MTKAANDNTDPWQTLAAATAKLLSNLDEDQKKEREEKDRADRADKAQRKDQSDYVSSRVREIGAFEARAAGKVRK